MKALRLFRCSKDCSRGHWVRSSAVASSDDLGPEGPLTPPSSESSIPECVETRVHCW
jgi:hypothetical protein